MSIDMQRLLNMCASTNCYECEIIVASYHHAIFIMQELKKFKYCHSSNFYITQVGVNYIKFSNESIVTVCVSDGILRGTKPDLLIIDEDVDLEEKKRFKQMWGYK